MPQDFSGQNLRGRAFSGLDLIGANFSYADIRGANFTNAILKGANFSYAKAGLKRRAVIGLLIIGERRKTLHIRKRGYKAGKRRHVVSQSRSHLVVEELGLQFGSSSNNLTGSMVRCKP